MLGKVDLAHPPLAQLLAELVLAKVLCSMQLGASPFLMNAP